MNWPEYLMGFARHAALKSKDSTQVGAVLVGPDREVRLTAYNGPPRGVRDLAERRERPAKYLYASHAEANLVAFAAREGIRTDGCTVYVTHAPCASCARTLIQAGIVCVIAGSGTTSMPAEEFEAAHEMMSEAGIIFQQGDFNYGWQSAPRVQDTSGFEARASGVRQGRQGAQFAAPPPGGDKERR